MLKKISHRIWNVRSRICSRTQEDKDSTTHIMQCPLKPLKLAEVDYIGAVCFTGNKERYEFLMKEIERCKLPRPNVVWTFPTPYRELILKSIPHLPSLETHPGYWGAGIGHYQHIKIAYELGCETALIVEDDCRFLKDFSIVDRTMLAAPDDWDFLMLDNFRVENPSPVGKGWVSCSSTFSTACYVVNRRAMAKLIELNEAPLLSGAVMRHCDHWANKKYLGEDFKIYCANPNLAIQCHCPDTTNTGGKFIQNLYLKNRISPSRYASYGATSDKKTLENIKGNIAMINWKKYCDKIYCIHCVNYHDRVQDLMDELERVDVLKSGILELRENYKNPVDDFLKSKTGAPPSTLIMPLFIETYRILAEAQYKGYKSIAIMEDDVRFLKDKRRITNILDAIPDGYNCIQLSRISCHSQQVARNWARCQNNKINEFFVHADGCEIWSGAFYILSAEGISQLLAIMSQNARNPDGLFHLMSGLAITNQDIVIQKPLKNSVRGGHNSLESMKPEADIFGTRTEDFN